MHIPHLHLFDAPQRLELYAWFVFYNVTTKNAISPRTAFDFNSLTV